MSKELSFWNINWIANKFAKDLDDIKEIRTKLWKGETLTYEDRYLLRDRLTEFEVSSRLINDEIMRLEMKQEANVPFWKKFFRI